LPAVVLSSQDVYAQFGRLNGLPAPEPEALVTESSPLTIPFPFREVGGHDAGPDYDKKEVEEVVREAVDEGAPGAAILRLPAVYGARDYRRRFGGIVDAVDEGVTVLPCAGGASFRHAHAHVLDVAHAIVLAAEHRLKGFEVFNVAEAIVPTMRERAEALARVMGVRFRWLETSEPLPPRFATLGKMPNDLVTDTSRIRASLGFREVTTEDQRWTDTLAWLRASRPS
jgi:nucleoside-diphosphate-sugar epimerase